MEGSSGKDSGCADEGGMSRGAYREIKVHPQSGWAWGEFRPYSQGGEKKNGL